MPNKNPENKSTEQKPAPATSGQPGLAVKLKVPEKKKRLSKKTWIIIGVISALVLIAAAAGGYIYYRHHKKKAVVVVQKPTEPPKPVLVAAPLTGVLGSAEAAAKPVVAVIEENLYPDARPQSGLSSAGIVYEALAEGGITRYEAFYQEPLPPDLGPIRSLRTYFAYWGREYNVPVVHAGGNLDALDLIGPLGMKNLDQFSNGSYFRRITTRYAPHNLYIYGQNLEKLMSDKGYATKPDFTPWPHKDDAKATTPNASTINVDYSYFDYQVKFTYNPDTNNYTRYLRNVLDTDANGNTPIKPKNIVVMYMPTSYGKTRIGEDTVIMQVVGSGKGQVFQDGTETDITWSKASNTARTTLTNANGQPVSLDRGQTWVCVVPVGKTVTFQ